MNVGASKPTDYGLYFQWGDAQGYTADQVGKDKIFNWSDYKWNPSGDGEAFTKYTTTGATLELKDDAAHVNWGGEWHMPTPKQIQELIDNTTITWTTLDGVNGRLFTSTKDTSKSIFIPAAGYVGDSSVSGSGEDSFILSSAVSTNEVYDGQVLVSFLHPLSSDLNNYARDYGFSVRGVIG